MGTASYIKKVYVLAGAWDPNDEVLPLTAASNVLWLELPCSGPSLNSGADVLDDTTTATGTGFRARVLALLDWSINCDSHYAAGNLAIQAVRNAMLTRTPLWVRYLPKGGAMPGLNTAAATAARFMGGVQGPSLVETFNAGGGVSDLEMVAISLQATGRMADAANIA